MRQRHLDISSSPTLHPTPGIGAKEIGAMESGQEKSKQEQPKKEQQRQAQNEMNQDEQSPNKSTRNESAHESAHEPACEIKTAINAISRPPKNGLQSGFQSEVSVQEKVSNPLLRNPPTRWHEWKVQPPERDGWGVCACPSCARVDRPLATLLANRKTGQFYCVHCGYHGNACVSPTRYREAPPLEALLHVPAPNGMRLEAVLKGMELEAQDVMAAIPDMILGSGYFESYLQDGSQSAGWYPCIMLPVRATCDGEIVDVVQIRFHPQTGAFISSQRAKSGKPLPWGWENAYDDRVVMVDNPIDAMALRGAGEKNVIALPEKMNPIRAGGGDWSVLSLADVEKRMNVFMDIILAFSSTDENHRFEEELGRRLGLDRCRRTRWLGHVIPNGGIPGAAKVIAVAGKAAALTAIENASPFPIAGVHELIDVDERFELLYEFGLQPGLSTDWPTLDIHYTVKLGQWTVVTGIPGHGKSTFLDALLINLARRHGLRTGIFSPENQPIERHFAGLMEKALGAPFNEGPTPRITPEQKDATKSWLNEHFKIILPDEEKGNWTIDGVLDLARVLVYRHGIQGLIIDPWNELDHTRPSNLTETEHISQSLTKIRRFARLYGVHIWIIAHPTKLEPRADGKYPVPTPYMISGGAHWRNKADNALSIFRNVGDIDEDVVDIHVQKIRFKEVGRVGRVSLRSDPTCGRYYDDIDQAARARALASGAATRSEHMRVKERTCEPLIYMDDHEDPLAGFDSSV